MDGREQAADPARCDPATKRKMQRSTFLQRAKRATSAHHAGAFVQHPAKGPLPVVRPKSNRPSRRTSAAAFDDDPPQAGDPLLGFAPYLHVAPRRNSITPDRQRAFIAQLAATGIVTQAARAIGASLEALYRLRHRKGAEGFSAAWDMALDRGIARLEDVALERAIRGDERVIVRGGKVVHRYRRHNDALLMFLLRQRRAERFGVRGDWRDLKPGHPVYERLRKEWQREEYDYSTEAVRKTLDKKIAALCEQVRARKESERAALTSSGDVPGEGASANAMNTDLPDGNGQRK